VFATINNYLRSFSRNNPKVASRLLVFGSFSVIFLAGIALVGIVFHVFNISQWWLLLAAPVILVLMVVGFFYVATRVVGRLRFGFKNAKDWQQLFTPFTRSSLSPFDGLDRLQLDRLLSTFEHDINDADSDGYTLLDHMFDPMYRRVFKADDVEYLLSLGAREPKDLIAKLRAVDHDDAYLLADKLQAQERQPELEAIAIATRGEVATDDEPRRRM
jgi:hypothetical protein